MNHKLFSTVVFALSLALGQTAFAYSKVCGEGMKKMVASLKLDNAQKEKVKPILEQLKSTMKDNMAQMKDLRNQINQQVTSDTMDQATVDSLIDKKVKLMGDMMKARSTARHQIYGLLNPKQKEEHQKMMKKWEEKMSSMVEKCKMND